MSRLGLRTAACLAAIAALASCASDQSRPTALEPFDDLDPRDLPIVGFVVGEYDGTELTFRDATFEELEAAGIAIPGRTEVRGDDRVGVAEQPLIDIPSMACGSGCTGTSYVGFTNVATTRRKVVNGAASGTDTQWTNADLTDCGAPPTTGVCVDVRMRNMYTLQLERVYVELVSLTPSGMTTSVSAASMPYTARSDFGITPDFTNAMWRYGEIARSTSVTGSPAIHWAFTGSTPAGQDFTFNFLAQVRGLVVSPTRRATLASGQTDNPGAGAYTAQNSGTSFGNSSGVSISENGRYVAFTSNHSALTGSAVTTEHYVLRKDLQTGAIVRANSVPCTDPINPHLSSDGSVVVFSARNCDLAGLGSTSSTNQVFVHDFSSGTTALASISTTGGYGNTSSINPRISADGQTVVFQSTATNLIAGQPVRTACNEVYRYDRATQSLSHVSAVRDADIFDTAAGWAPSCGGTTPAGETPDISGDGNIIVFASNQPLETTDAATGKDIYVYDHAATQGAGVYVVYRVSLSSSGAALSGGTGTTGVFNQPAVSVNGSMLVFSSDATDVFGAGTSTAGRRHVYRRQVAEGANSSIQRVTLRVDDGEPSASSTGIAAISTSGRFVAFWSNATDLASAGTFAPTGFQVYVCDMGAPIASLTRCWVASTLQPDASMGSAFNVFSGTASASSRIGLAYASDIDPGYVVYQASPTANWGALNGLGTQVFISPVSDPRYQQAATGP